MTVPSLGSWKISPTYTGPFALQGRCVSWLRGITDDVGSESSEDVEHVADEDVEEDELDELVLVFSLMIAS